MDEAYANALDGHLNTLARFGCRVSRDGYQVCIQTPDGRQFHTRDFSTAQGKEWGAIRCAMQTLGIGAEDVMSDPGTPPGAA